MKTLQNNKPWHVINVINEQNQIRLSPLVQATGNELFIQHEKYLKQTFLFTDVQLTKYQYFANT